MKGQITASLATGGDGKVIKIVLQDENSGLRVASIELSPENFGLMIGGLSFMKCNYQTYNNFNILGKVKECKNEIINISTIKEVYNSDNFKKEMKELVKPYEIDGWKVNTQDIESYNSHHYKDNKYSVGFYRYVDKEDKEI